MDNTVRCCTRTSIACLLLCGWSATTWSADATENDNAQYAIPTRIDRIGRIVVPVKLNGRGPFRLMLDTGATHSVITNATAHQLNVDMTTAQIASVQGVMGRITAPTARISELRAGSLKLHGLTMPIIDGTVVTELDGILGAEGLSNKVVTADFINDRIKIVDSSGLQPTSRYAVIKFELVSHRLVVVDAMVGRHAARAVIDTGGSQTLGNLPLLQILTGNKITRETKSGMDVIDITNTSKNGNVLLVPRITLDSATITDATIIAGDFEIFRIWRLDQRPALLIGMDVLGQLGELSIDYKRRELWILER